MLHGARAIAPEVDLRYGFMKDRLSLQIGESIKLKGGKWKELTAFPGNNSSGDESPYKMSPGGERARFQSSERQEVVKPTFRGTRFNSLRKAKLMSFSASRFSSIESNEVKGREEPSRPQGKYAHLGTSQQFNSNVGSGCISH